MKKENLNNNIEYKQSGPAINVLFETDFTKEIRIVFKEGQIMKEHQTPFPIVVELFSGNLEFGVNGEIHSLQVGDILALNGGVPHNLKALSNCIVRLSLSKQDKVKRVMNVNN